MNWIRNFFKNYNNLGSELFFLILLTVFATTINLLTIHQTDKKLSAILDVDLKTKIILYQMQINLSTASDLQQKFLLEWKNDGLEESVDLYVTPSLEEMDALITQIEELEHSTYVTEETNASFKKIIENVYIYNQEFENLVQIIGERGYLNTGHEGVMRDAAHKLETKFSSLEDADNSELNLLFLQVRRREKDYISRQDLQYVTQLYENIDLLKIALAKQSLERHNEFEILTLLDQYQRGFDGILETDTKIETLLVTLKNNRAQINSEIYTIIDEINIKIDIGIDDINSEFKTMLTYLSITAISIFSISIIILYLLGRIEQNN